MEFYINPYDGVPVYLQIIQQVKAAMSMETMRSGDRLPTVRELAGTLAVNPNTVAKAYRDLERDGVVETVSGKGTFIKDGYVTRESKLEMLD
jgi:GntR family transcriptional regulator